MLLICLHRTEGSEGMPNDEIRQQISHLMFLDRMCQQNEDNDRFWKDETKKAFSVLRNVRNGVQEAAIHLGPFASSIVRVDSSRKISLWLRKASLEPVCCHRSHYIRGARYTLRDEICFSKGVHVALSQ